MADSTLWWVVAGGLVVAELLTGTFYLLMLALGAAAAAIGAHLQLPQTAQVVVAAIAGGGAVVAWHLWGRQRLHAPSDDLKLDVGETIMVEHWNPDGTASVRYRGTQWTAIHRPGITPSTGMHRVAEMTGNRLLLDPA